METNIKTGVLNITSTAFKEGGEIPSQYTCEGKNVNPPIQVTGIPGDAKSLALIMEDPDAPNGTFDHWIVWNMPAVENIQEDSVVGISGTNGFGKTGYDGPCPPSGSHRYYFKFYALDKKTELKVGAGKQELQQAMKDSVLAKGELMGRYEKKKVKSPNK